MKRILKTALSFGLTCYFGLASANFIFSLGWTWKTYVFQLFATLTLGILYAVALRATINRIGNDVVVNVPSGDHEIRKNGCTYIKGRAGFPGRLLLTDKQLIFKSKKINDKDFNVVIDRTSINLLDERKSWWGPANDLIVKTNNNEVFRFVVYAPEEWIADIQISIKKIATV